MKLVDRQVLRELVGPFIFGVMAFSSVLFVGAHLQKLTNWIMNGMPLTTAAQMVLLILPVILVITLPMGTLLAVLLGVGRLSGDSEITALLASGVSLLRIAGPVFALGLVVSFGSIALNEAVAPSAYERYELLQAEFLKQSAPQDQPFTVRDAGTNSVIMVNGGMDLDTGMLRDVTVTRFSKNRPITVIYAARAAWAGMNDSERRFTWRLYDGWSQMVGNDSPAYSGFSETRINEIKIMKTPEQFALYRKIATKKADQMSFKDLSRMLAYIKQYPDRPAEEIRQLEVNRWNKLALPLSSLVFAMLAAPLGIKPHRSASSVGFGLSILIILLYWMLWRYTSSLAVQGNVTPLVGAFFADVVGLAASFVLIRKAAT